MQMSWTELLAWLEKTGFTCMEIDLACVKKADFKAAYEGDGAAKTRLRAALQGVQLYMHGFHVKADEMLVPIRTLHEIDVVEHVTVECGGQQVFMFDSTVPERLHELLRKPVTEWIAQGKHHLFHFAPGGLWPIVLCRYDKPSLPVPVVGVHILPGDGGVRPDLYVHHMQKFLELTDKSSCGIDE